MFEMVSKFIRYVRSWFCFLGFSLISILVSGFLGKSILEKLLRSCPEVEKIFVLVRSKKGHNPYERVESLFESKVSLL